MSKSKYQDLLNVNPSLNYDKPMQTMSGGSRFIETVGIHSGRFKKINSQYKDIPFHSGNQSTQTQINEFMHRMRKQTGGRFYNSNEDLMKIKPAVMPRPAFATYGNEYLYHK